MPFLDQEGDRSPWITRHALGVWTIETGHRICRGIHERAPGAGQGYITEKAMDLVFSDQSTASGLMYRFDKTLSYESGSTLSWI